MTSLLLLLLVSTVSLASASLACTSCTVELRKSVATQPFSLCLSLWQLDKADTAIRKHACQYDECALHPHLQHQPTATASVQCYACVDRCDCPDFSCDIHRGRSHFTVLLRSHGLRKHCSSTGPHTVSRWISHFRCGYCGNPMQGENSIQRRRH